MTEPLLVGELLPGVLQEVIDRAGSGYERWAEQVAATGYCAHPVRLRGRVEHADPQTAEVRMVYSTDREPDANLLKGCGNRRASVCPSCSATYKADSFQLLAAGAARGQGRARHGGRASAAVCHLHRPIVRPSAYPQGPGATGLPVPSLPPGPSVPAWPPGRLLAVPRR
jgi:hypothetical protein